jgi:RimJ/RimL family protein N-acetyltransferase
MVAIIDRAGLDVARLPLELEAWLRLGHRLAFTCGDVEFEQFGAADTMDLYRVRNDPSVRPFMPSPEPLPLARHRDWVRSHLLDVHAGSPLVLVGRAAGEAVAFGLLKPTAEAGVLEIGVIVAGPRQHGPVPLRLGAALFTIAARVFGAHTLVSHVHHGHRTALRLNRAVGLIPDDGSAKPGETLFRTPMSAALSTPVYRRCARQLVIHIERPAAE